MTVSGRHLHGLTVARAAARRNPGSGSSCSRRAAACVVWIRPPVALRRLPALNRPLPLGLSHLPPGGPHGSGTAVAVQHSGAPPTGVLVAAAVWRPMHEAPLPRAGSSDQGAARQGLDTATARRLDCTAAR